VAAVVMNVLRCEEYRYWWLAPVWFLSYLVSCQWSVVSCPWSVAKNNGQPTTDN